MPATTNDCRGRTSERLDRLARGMFPIVFCLPAPAPAPANVVHLASRRPARTRSGAICRLPTKAEIRCSGPKPGMWEAMLDGLPVRQWSPSRSSTKSTKG